MNNKEGCTVPQAIEYGHLKDKVLLVDEVTSLTTQSLDRIAE